MASIQFSGLSSGLDTAGIISKLMSVESAPQTALKTRVATQQSQVAELQRLNTTVLAVKDSAASFATGSTWTALAATSSNAAVAVTASSTATPVQVGVTVDAVAASGRGYLNAPLAANTTLTLRKADGTAFQVKDANGNLVDLTINTGDGSLAKIAQAINATTQTSGLQAAVINSTTPVLMVTSASTGTASNFSITDATSTVVSGTGGANAAITVNGQQVTSTSNTFTNVMPGVTLTLGADAKVGTTATVTVADDGKSRSTAMKAFVDQINGLLDAISADTAYGAITAGKAPSGGGLLSGDSSLRAMADQVVRAVLPDSAVSVLAKAGLSVDRNGRLTFDATAFAKAYAADPAGIQAAFVGTGGVTDRVGTLAKQISDPFDGTLTGAIKGRQTEIARTNDKIAAWDDRLAMKQASLEQQYAALETMLGRLRSQQSWLTSQIESLDGLAGSK